MSYCRTDGKDKIIFATAEDHAVPSTVTLSAPENSPGLILPNGEINWNCPCLGGIATGPCGVEFREAFSCFHYSTAEPKGSDCVSTFQAMQECMSKYPTLYKAMTDDDSDDNDQLMEALESSRDANSEGAVDSVSPEETEERDSKFSESDSKK
ncbi:mitochondrial intermembrane space import and assembly protein 40-B [Ischnura elegans]|uniref:mitochondrial intermembrane space import and assembly protein 40-B n=1 Tax=Ischnura elegans TaxID=197161 RepID=UPI001ED8B691|nr:mitochondrial intermembrane space import and assembly protein 40-B [Ischnura elegans]XP_046401676.1 mitochondrial intermembrane space import and assembly protein 40-B [Ischnura elegans]